MLITLEIIDFSIDLHAFQLKTCSTLKTAPFRMTWRWPRNKNLSFADQKIKIAARVKERGGDTASLLNKGAFKPHMHRDAYLCIQ